ncbi:MAG TPA: hypothetical protein PKV67_06275 [Hyphomonas sp.]|nr:hypothetical protein [Hyphomonas sp.]HRJ00364.1 hypothetical protein [Hyphomonas sp.]HRK66023.1 hypothetical protein [Hyphomonas sp.]
MAKLIRMSVAGLAVSALALSAFADQVGAVTATTGEADQVIVVRGNETFSLSKDDVIFEGDQVITRSGGTAEISVADCTRQLGSLESIIVDDEFCTKAIASVDPSGTILADAAIEGGRGVGAAMPLAAVFGLGTAAAASGGRSGGNGRPSSN